MTDDGDDDLAFTIAFALSGHKAALRRVPKHDSIPHRTPVAKAVIRQVELSGWRLTKRPAREAHSTHPATRWHVPPEEEGDATG